MTTPPRPKTSINSTHYPTEFEQIILEKSQNFVGREFVFTAIANFLHRYNRGYFTIVGAPGSGKSAILAKYAIDNPRLVYYNAQLAGKNRAEEFLASISTQIAQIFAVDILPATSLNTILQQVSDRLQPAQSLIIAIDGLDNINRNNQPPGSNLFYLPRYLPSGVYFLLTRRPFLREKSGLLIEAPSQILDLNDYRKENRSDVQVYIWQELTAKHYPQQIGKERLSEFVGHLTDTSENNFMFLSQILSDIHSYFYDDVLQFLDTRRTTNKLPPCLKNSYQKLWEKMSGQGLSDLAKSVLLILIDYARNQSGVSVENIAQAINADEFDVEEVLENWVEFLQYQQTGDVNYYSLFHSIFCDWLRQKI